MMEPLAAAALAFVGTHIGLAVPSVRRPLVRALGDRGFTPAYSLIAIATLVWLVRAYRDAPVIPLWNPPSWAWYVALVLMLAAAILFIGSMNPGNRALIGARGETAAQDVKKDALAGAEWADYRRVTSFVPFGRGLAGPGWRATLLGLTLLLVATWAHPHLGAPPVPPWLWLV